MKGESILVKQLLQKAKDAAMLSVEFYNKPAVSFKSEGFITMMIIAWTSLFHAYFLKNNVKPFYHMKDSCVKKPRFESIEVTLSDGKKIKDKKWWEITECIKEYFNDEHPALRKNLEFFIPLRDMIVHRYLPELDGSIFGECQSLITNLNNFIEKYFGNKYSIKHLLSFSLQLDSSPKNFIEATKEELKKKGAEEIVNYIKSYRSLLTTEQFESPEYSFKAVLIQVKNHDSKDALSLRFINEKNLTQDIKEKFKNNGIVLIKENQVKVEDDVLLKDYPLTYDSLTRKLKNEIINFKLNKEFHKIKKELINENKSLVYERKLNPNNPKSIVKVFYSHRIVDLFKEIYKNK